MPLWYPEPVLAFVAAAILGSSSASYQINPNHTMLWNGTPYIPVGVRLAPDTSEIKTALDAGVKDFLIEVPLAGGELPESIAMLEQANANYLLTITAAAPSAMGFEVEPDSYRIAGIDKPTEIDVHLPGAERVLVVLSIVHDGSFRWAQMHEVRNGRLQITVDPQSTQQHVVNLYPQSESLVTPDLWEDFDVRRDDVYGMLDEQDFRSGWRGIVNPLGTVQKFVDPQTRFVPTSELFRMEFATFLERKYGTVTTLRRAWEIRGSELDDFASHAKLVPLFAENRGVPALFDPDSGSTYQLGRRMDLIWNDIREVILSSSTRRYARLIDGVVNRYGVPVIQDWAGWHGPYSQSASSLAGVGFQMPPSSMSQAYETAGPAVGIVHNSTALSTVWGTDLRVNTTDLTTIGVDRVVTELEGMGVRGFFFSTSNSHDLIQIATLAAERRLDTSAADWKPQILPYPLAARWPAFTGRIEGGYWWIPINGAGERSDYGEYYDGYRVVDNVRRYSVIWSNGEPRRSRIYVTDPENVEIESITGADLQIRRNRNFVEATLPTSPVIFRSGDVIPVPVPAQEEGLGKLGGLFAFYQQMVDPTGSEMYRFMTSSRNFDSMPAESYRELRDQLQKLARLAAPFLWWEAENSREQNIGGAYAVSGASRGSVIGIEPRIRPQEGYFSARYTGQGRIAGSHTIWIAGHFPPSLLPLVKVYVNGQEMEYTQRGGGNYGPRFGWYDFGTVDFGMVAVYIEIRVPYLEGAKFELDAVVAAPAGFRPDGAFVPTDWITPAVPDPSLR